MNAQHVREMVHVNAARTGSPVVIVTGPGGRGSSSNGGCSGEQSNPCNGSSMKLTRNGEGDARSRGSQFPRPDVSE